LKNLKTVVVKILMTLSYEMTLEINENVQ